MYKYILLGCLIVANVAYASEGEMVSDNKLKNVNMISAYGVMTFCYPEHGHELYASTGVDYAWDYFVFNKISVGLSYNLFAFASYPNSNLLLDNGDNNKALSTLGLRASYYFGNKKSIVVPHLSIDGRLPIGSNTEETGGLLWAYNAGAMFKLNKHVYIAFAGSRMFSKSYFYNIVKIGITGMIY
jgi:hypothetical protein